MLCPELEDDPPVEKLYVTLVIPLSGPEGGMGVEIASPIMTESSVDQGETAEE
jgi:hypothetical protein